jgi:hypothetical protein
MKKTNVIRVIAVIGFVIAGTATSLQAKPKENDSDDPATVATLTSGVWHIEGQSLKGKKWSNDFTFYADHTVIEGKNKKLTWAISDNKVLIKFPTYNNVMFLPLDPKGTKGLSNDGSQNIATRIENSQEANTPQSAVNGAGSSATAPQKKVTVKSSIDTIMDTAPATTENVVAPLDAKLMPPKKLLKVGADITALREKLLDEAATAPASSPDAYKAAVGLCNAWINALDERNQIANSKTQAPMGTADMNSNTPVHPNEYSLEQEAIDAKKKKQDDAKENAFFNDAQKQVWVQRAPMWRQYLTQLYTQLGAIRRQATTAAATPAATP